MAVANVATIDDLGRARAAPEVYPEPIQTQASAVSWGAILAGAAAAAALSLILLILGTGLGLSSVSPWAHDGISATTFGVSTILWVTLTQLVAAAMGGYLAGRLRTRWVAVHTDEVYFRDTAHGFLAWAVASLATAALLTTAIGTIVGGGIQAGASVAGGVATTVTAAAAGGAAVAGGTGMAKADSESGLMDYFVDSLFRQDPGTAAAGTQGQAAVGSSPEVTRIFINAIRTGTLPPEDVRYVGQVVAQRTSLTQQEAEKRVSDTYARVQETLRAAEASARETADTGRKASAYAALWLFISLLIGAFVASLSATYGGRRRDI